MAKIAVYAICKNEAAHAHRFMTSMKEADGIFILDTGSTDDSPRILRDLGAVVHETNITPWRFDVARNLSLSLVPLDYDICVCCDLDEVFAPGWRKALEQAWQADTTRLSYPFYYDDSGSFFFRSLIHSRKGYLWAWPIHEALLPMGAERVATCTDIRLYHLPDRSKSRAFYLPMLEQAVREYPHDPRMLRYLGREYLYHSQWQAAIDTLSPHVELETWDAERSASLRDIARCYLTLGQPIRAEAHDLRAIQTCPTMREGYIELAQLYLSQARYAEAEEMIRQALCISDPHPSYFNESWAWNGTAEAILAAALSAQ
ncbi:MAG: glycosyltransferase [Clostridia bacterium]|nr:glycosyltransferase [Clostridia bacterium]